MGSTIDGLISGMSTSDLIKQLMQVESASQNRLRSKVTAHQSASSALQAVNLNAASIKSNAESVLKADTWKLAKASSSAADALTVTATSGATSGQLTLAVSALARNHVRTVAVASSGAVTTGAGIDLTINGTLKHVDVATDTAEGVASAINSAGLDVKAAVVNADGGQKILQFTATKTGTASQFTISGLQAGGGDVVSAGQDAQLTVGTIGSGGYTVSSATNTFVDVLPSVTFTALKVQSGITVTVGADAEGIAAKVSSMIDVANAMLGAVAAKAVPGGEGRSAGPLAGNALVRQLSGDMLSTVAMGKTDYGSFAQLGIQLSKTGRLTFDQAKFIAAYQADPAKVESALTAAGNGTAGTRGLAASLNTFATNAKTQLESAIQTRDTSVRGLNSQIAEWDVRLELRQKALERQFSNLEVALGKMKDQSSWLAGQIASLG